MSKNAINHPETDSLTEFVLDNGCIDLRNHVESCEQCAEAVSEIQAIKQTLTEAPEEDVPEEVRQAIFLSARRKKTFAMNQLFFSAVRLVRNPALIALGVATAAIFLYLFFLFVS